MIVAEVQDRLRAHAATSALFALIEGAAELADVEKSPNQSPAAYVIPMREASSDNTLMNGVMQRTEIDFAVVIITENVSDARGEAAAGDIEALKKAVRRALVGWEPPSADDIVTHVAGELTRAREGVVWWEDTFGTATFLTDED